MLYNQDWDRKPKSVSDVLLKAADLLEQRGHAKFIRVHPNGSMCFLGALEVAQGYEGGYRSPGGDGPLTREAALVTAKVLGLTVCYTPYIRIADWNNLPERTAQEVIDAMRLAATVAAKESVDA